MARTSRSKLSADKQAGTQALAFRLREVAEEELTIELFGQASSIDLPVVTPPVWEFNSPERASPIEAVKNV